MLYILLLYNCLGCFWTHLLSLRDREEQTASLKVAVFLQLSFSVCSCLKMDLLAAAKTNNLERVRLLVEQGADKDEGGIGGYTPLFWASRKGQLQVARYLVEQGATLDKASNYGTTPLSTAAVGGHLEVARFLLEQGANRDKTDDKGWTPLHCAALMGNLDTVMLLMSYGADLNARDNDGELPIDYASTEEVKQAIRDEPRRRMDHGHKRATEQDRHLNSETSAAAQQEVEEQSTKCPRLGEGASEAVAAEEETKVAEEDEDSEPSDEEFDD